MAVVERVWTPGDLRTFAPSDAARADLALLPPAEQWRMTVLWTLWHQETPLAIYGALLFAGEVVEGYVLVLCSTHVPQYALPLVRHLRAALHSTARRYAVTRFYAETRMHFPQGHRLLQCMDFEPGLTFYAEHGGLELYQQYVWTAKE